MKNIFASLLFIFALQIVQIQAREIYEINDSWRIYPASKSSGDDARTVSIPHCWGEDSDTPISLTSANYLRSIYAPAEWLDQRVFLKFHGVQSIADLFVNGLHVGEHRGGATSFCFEITQYLEFGQDNTLLVRVSSAAQNDLLPTSIEHEVYGGIYRDVELVVTPKVAISPMFYGSDGVFVTTTTIKNKKVSGDVKVYFLSDLLEERRVELTISDLEGNLCFRKVVDKMKLSSETPLSIPFDTKDVELWSPKSPTLYRVTVGIAPSGMKEDEEGYSALCDEVSVVTGFRIIDVANDGTVKGQVSINSEPQLMRGVSLYHDHPMGGGVLTPMRYNADMRMVRDLGANAIRSAVVPHDRYLYSLCDQDGIMVWVDTPLSRSSFFSDVAYFPTERFEENGIAQLKEVVYQNYNHPSIVMWSIFSLLSTRGDVVDGYVSKLNTVAKEIDPTRPTVALSNQNGKINEISDLIVWRQNIGWDKGVYSDVSLWQELIHNRWNYLRSGVMFGEKGVVDHQIDRSDILECRNDNRDNWFPEPRQSEMHEEYSKYLSQDSLFWGLWLPAMFDYKSPRRTLGESSDGLVTFDRSTRKDAYYLYRALWNKSRPTLYIADKRNRMIRDSFVTLRVYGSADTLAPVVTLRGEEFVMDSIAPAQYRLDSLIIRGRSKLLVRQGQLTDSVELIYGSPLRARER